MADEFFTRTPHPAPSFAPPKRSSKGLIAAVALAFLAGAGGVGYLAWANLLPAIHRGNASTETTHNTAPAPAAKPASQADAEAAAQAATARQAALDARIAGLEQHLDQIDLRTEAATGNSARSEALLVAFAARRALDRGAPLGILEDQLRLRFGEAQPRAVATVIESSRKPVTLSQLLGGLDALSPSLSATPAASLGTWAKISHELSSLFVIRHDTTPSPAPANRLDRARLALETGRVDDAITEVRGLPGAADASGWIADARRFADARSALDVIESTALLETRTLRDANGHKLEQPSPITAAPAGAATKR